MTVDPESVHPRLLDRLADRLRAIAEDITDEWLRALGERLGVRPARLLPTDELRDHIPGVIIGAAEFLESPVPQLSNQSVDTLRTLAQLRREQGYDIQEILTEIDVLSDLVFQRAAEWAEEQEGGLSGAAGLHAGARLNAVLRAVSSVAVGTYREEELRHDRELSERLGDFAATLSHELMNPLTAANVSAEMLADEEISSDPESRTKHTDRIRHVIDRMYHLVDDIRSLAVAEGARAEPRWISIRKVVDTVLEEVAPAAERYGVVVRADEPVEDFEVDAVRVEIALMNLVSNAIKFADPEKEDRWVRVRTAPAEGEGLSGGWRITVEDNGRGIPGEFHNKVFQRFFRGYPEIEGTGLGLEIAKRVVEQRGGTLSFESEPGTGTTFFLEIPQRLEAREKEPGEVER